MTQRRLQIRTETWPIRGSFRIARGAKTEAHVVVAEITSGKARGHGECVSYARFGESLPDVASVLENLAGDVARGLTRSELQKILPAGAARNALDCALLDLEAKESGQPAYSILGLPSPRAVSTAFTISLGTPEDMAQSAVAAVAQGYDLLKLKIAGAGDLERVQAVREGAPHARLIVDANEGWSENDFADLIQPLARLGVGLIEQPLPAGRDDALRGFQSPIPICADEGCHTRSDLAHVAQLYSHVNVKLDKAGGLTEALALSKLALESGLRLMVGCMVATSLSMAPAMLLASLADFVDLDGPLLLERDREPGITYERAHVMPPSPALWG